MKKDTIDFLAVGDLVIDHFIKLKDAEVSCDIDHENCKIAMRWGDKIPYEKVDVVKSVGNSPNAAVSAARLGLSSALMSHVGQDDDGKNCMKVLKDQGVITDFMTEEADKHTNNHYVLSFNAERTILIKHEAFTYDLTKQVEGKPVPKWLYFSSVGEDSMQYHEDIAKWVADNDIKMAFQPGTFQISLGYEKLKFIYEACELFFCNKEEAQRILKSGPSNSSGQAPHEIRELAEGIHGLGPNIVCITDGPNGAYVLDRRDDTNDLWFIPMYPDPKEPVDRTGAGDAFSSTFTAALAVGKNIEEALAWGPINSMNVVQYVGAQEGLLSKENLEEYLANAPENYKPKKI